MADPALALTELFQPAFDALEPGADPVVRPSERADYQINGVLPLAKRLGRNPRDVAQQVLAAVDTSAVCESTEIAGPGFVNVTLAAGFLAAQVGEQARAERLGVRRAAVTERVVVDYSAPNTAKEMHVGHLRTTIIGDALVRLLEFVGHTVVRENHVGDWGLQFGMLIEHLVDIGEDSAAAELSTGDLTGFYKQAKVSFDADDAFKERARERVVMLQSGDAETLRLWHVLVDQSDAYFQQVYDRLDVKLRPEDTRGESAYNDMLPVVVTDLEAAGLLVESDGAMCVFPPGFSGRDGQPQPLIVRNRNGGFGYAATDLATVRDRVGRLGATWLIYVVGAPQAQHLAMVWKTCEEAGWLVPPARAVHVPFGSVLGEDRKMYRTRSGETVKLTDLLDEAVDRAEARIAEANPAITGDERATVARAIGIGAVKYADLANDRIKDYVFSFDRMLAFEGNTGPYIQYAHARISKILRDAGPEAADLAGEVPVLGEPSERELAKALLGFDAAVHDTIDKLGPHRLCTYLFDLAQTFTSFYEACPVLKAGVPADLRRSRLALCALTQRVIAAGLDLLGIAAPARM
jgi:arginyl-tRNA synthetase